MCTLNLCNKIGVMDFTHIFQDKQGHDVFIRVADIDDYGKLLKMYDSFEPKRCAQGMPPADPEVRKKLVRSIINDSLNVVAINSDEIIGHSCLIDIEPGVRGELEIAVHQDWRNLGVGTVLMKLLIEVAGSYGYKRIWLTVDNLNRRAIHVYQKYGFVFAGPIESEREMELIFDEKKF